MVKNVINSLTPDGIKNAFKSFAKKHDFVYFGSADEHDEPIKGMTFSPDRTDKNFIHATYQDFDINILERTTPFSHPEHDDDLYTWAMVCVHIDVKNLPHILIDGKRYDDLFYKNIFTKYPNLRAANTQVAAVDQAFSHSFMVYSGADVVGLLEYYVKPDLTQLMTSKLSDYDLELLDDSVCVYYKGKADEARLQNMLDVSVEVSKIIRASHEALSATLPRES